MPKYDQEKNTYVEPFLPHYVIGIMHLAAGIWINNKDMRLNKDLIIDIECTDKKKIKKSLRFVV